MSCTLKKHVSFAVTLCLVSVGVLHAQRAPSDATPGAAAGGRGGTDQLEEVVVKGVLLEDQVSPLQRRVTSVLGPEISVLDTRPRAMT